MSRNTKIILGILAALVVLCLCIAGGFAAFTIFAANKAGQAIDMDPAQVEAQAGAIAGFDLPAGFEPAVSMDLLGMKMAGYNSSDERSHIFLMQFPASMQLSSDDMQKQIERAMNSSQQNYGDLEMKVVETRDVTIKGNQEQATISEGEGSNGSYRQLAVMFEGNGGQAFLIYMTPTENWDDAEVDAFLASFR